MMFLGVISLSVSSWSLFFKLDRFSLNLEMSRPDLSCPINLKFSAGIAPPFEICLYCKNEKSSAFRGRDVGMPQSSYRGDYWGLKSAVL